MLKIGTEIDFNITVVALIGAGIAVVKDAAGATRHMFAEDAERLHVEFYAMLAAEHRAEAWAEGAWLRKAEEGDEESRRDLAEFDAMFPDGYAAGPAF